MGVHGAYEPRIDPVGGLVGGGGGLGYDVSRIEVIVKMQNKPEDQCPVNAHLISSPSKAQNIIKQQKYMVKKWH